MNDMEIVHRNLWPCINRRSQVPPAKCAW